MNTKTIHKYIYSTILVLLILSASVFGQDDEARQQSGLPTMIGNRPGATNLPNGTTTLSGTISIQGLTDEKNSPKLTVLVFANGQPFGKQTVKNKGSFIFNGIPTINVTLTVEADNLEIARYPMPQLNAPPLSNRQDIILTMFQINQAGDRQNEVISAKYLYKRSETNQKLFEKASSDLKKDKTESALKIFKQISENDEKDFIVWTEMGNIYFNTQKFSDAETAYQKAITLKPEFTPALINLGKLYISQKNAEKAVSTLTKAVEISPDSPDANHYLGEAYLAAKKGSKAVGYLNEAIRLAPQKKAEIHLRLASLSTAAGLKDKAIEEYKMFLAKVPDYPEKGKIEKFISDNSNKK